MVDFCHQLSFTFVCRALVKNCCNTLRVCVCVCLGDFKCETYCASVCVSAVHLKAECYSFFLQLTRAHLIAVLWEAIELPLELNQAKHTDTHVHTIVLNERRFPLSFVPLSHLHLLLPAPHPPASSVKAFGLNSCLPPLLSVTLCPVMLTNLSSSFCFLCLKC